MSMNQETVLQLLPAYAVGALDADEMLAVENFLEAERRFLAQVAAAEDAATLLAFTAPPALPPASVKQRLMSRLARDPLAVSSTADGATPQAGPSRRAWHWGWLQSLGTAVATAAVIATIGLLFYASSLQSRVAALAAQNDASAATAQALAAERDELAQRIAALDQEMAALEADNNTLTAQYQVLTQQQQQVAQRLDVTTSRLNLVGSANEAVILNSSPEAPNSRGAFYISGPQAAVVVHGLEPLPSDRIYQFWWVTPDGRQLPVAPVTVQAGVEPTWALFQVPADIPPFTVVGISVEPATGSPAPTGPMIVEGSQG
jgi:anti-sigma-K factor RskA